MSLDKLNNAAIITAPNIVLYGTGGRGKSSTASLFPHSIFLDTDHSIDAFSITKTPKLLGWEASKEENKHLGLKYWLDFLINEKHEFKSVILDTLDATEIYFKKQIMNDYTTEKYTPISHVDDNVKALNFGKGGEILADRIREEILKRLSILSKKKGMIVVVLAHQGKRSVKLPHSEDYQQTAPLLEKQVTSALESWADIIGLLDVRLSISEDGKAITSKDSYVFTEKKESYVAKQREGYQIPDVLDARKFAETINSLIN